MSDELVLEMEERMDKTVESLKGEYATLRAGRANPQLLERIMVDYYGTPSPITQVGNVSAPEARLLVISPWDASMIKEIEKAILKSDLGINPSNDGKVIRLLVPELDEERRKELVRVVRKKGEDAKVALRSIRRDSNELLKKQKKANELTEDDVTELEVDIQKSTDGYIKTIDTLIAAKEKEILSV